MTASGRWTLVVLAVIAVLIGAFLYELRDDTSSAVTSRASRSSVDPANQGASLATLRRTADLPLCAQNPRDAAASKLSGVRVHCAADGAEIDAAKVVGGNRPVVMNLWAYWCKPCADELPAMAAYQKLIGDDVLVVTVHQDEREGAALDRLAELGVRLPTIQDGQRRIAAALGVPNVMPATVVFRLDGSVAKIIPQAFTSAEEIAAAVRQALAAPN